MAAPLYTREILRLAASIPHLGDLEGADARADKRSPLCGSRVSVALSLDGQGRVSAFSQEVHACALGQAAAALLGRHVLGSSLGELETARDALRDFLAGRRDEPGEWPDVSLLASARPFAARHASILLAFDAAAEAAALAGAESARR